MIKWHETLAARIGLRLGGLALLGLAGFIGVRLFHLVHSHPPRDASPAELALCLAVFLCAVAGNVLLFVGAGLWRQVEVPGRWSAMLVEPRQFEVLLYREQAPSEGETRMQRDRVIADDREVPRIRDTHLPTA